MNPAKKRKKERKINDSTEFEEMFSLPKYPRNNVGEKHSDKLINSEKQKMLKSCKASSLP